MSSIRTKLLLWYIGSLIITALFFWYGIHEYMIPGGIEIFVGLVLVLSTVGFFIIYNFVQSISNLTNQMQKISGENLDKHVHIREGNDEIITLSRTFNELLDRIHIAFKREQQFIADMAHELKTPLATMKSSLELSLKKNKNLESEALLKEVNHLADTLKDVLDLAWTESTQSRLKGKPVDLSCLVDDLAEIAEKMTQSKSIIVEKHIEDKVILHGYKDKLARAFLNLIDNALKYTKHGKVIITLKKINGFVLFVVDDSGPGIPLKEQKHIFTRFYRGEQTSSVFGSGLGLAIARSIIGLHGGVIEVESKEKHGSRFIVRIPVEKESS